DCNGDGTVNNTDLGAVTANSNLSHPKGGRSKGTGSNDLYFDITNVDLAPGKTVSIPVKFGNATQTISNVYGIGVRVMISGITPAVAPTLDNTTSWLAATNALNYAYPLNNTAVDWVLARTDQQNTSGQGTIATLNFTVPANATVGTDITFSFDDAVVIDNRGIESYDVNPIDATAKIQFPESVEGVAGNLESVAIVPNPSGDVANMHIVLAKRDVLTISVTDITGRVVWTANNQYEAGTQRVELPASIVSSGVYAIRIAGEDNSYSSVLKWVKQ
ncbi:MAG: T9SS type A sorting domain-containing protein, partial [Taibaiella sp.]|nr:T9SS type A sorting domain-containing protein [Taibaiella sp.]